MDEKIQRIQGAMQGNRADLNWLIEQKRVEILHAAIYLTNAHDGEDLTQEVIIGICQGIHTLRAPEKFDVWVSQILQHKFYDFCRKRKQPAVELSQAEEFGELIEDRREFLPSHFAEDKAYMDMIMEIIGAFPMEQKLILYQFYAEGMRYEEIAEALGIPRKRVDNLLTRTRRQLREALSQRTGEVLLPATAPMGALPVMSQIFQQHRVAVVSQEACLRVTAAAQQALGAFPSPAPAASAAKTGGIAVKLTAVGAAVTVAVAGTAAWLGLHEAQPEPVPPPPPAVVEDAPEPTPAIHTVPDLIGAQAANTLEGMVSSGTTPETLLEFLKQIDATMGDTAYGIDDTQYTLFFVEREDKRLTVIALQTEDGSVTVRYLFGDQAEPVPQMDEIIMMMM